MRNEKLNIPEPSDINRPKRMSDIIHIHGEHMTLLEAEKRGMVVVLRKADGTPKTDSDDVIRFMKVSVH